MHFSYINTFVSKKIEQFILGRRENNHFIKKARCSGAAKTGTNVHVTRTAIYVFLFETFLYVKRNLMCA